MMLFVPTPNDPEPTVDTPRKTSRGDSTCRACISCRAGLPSAVLYHTRTTDKDADKIRTLSGEVLDQSIDRSIE